MVQPWAQSVRQQALIERWYSGQRSRQRHRFQPVLGTSASGLRLVAVSGLILPVFFARRQIHINQTLQFLFDLSLTQILGWFGLREIGTTIG
jgi:hypothetical protein